MTYLTYQSKKTKGPVLDSIAETFSADEAKTVSEYVALKRKVSFPSDWKSDLTLSVAGFNQNLVMSIMGRWKKYRGRSEATLLNGSYSVSDGSFRGTQYGPSIDTWGEHPGVGWEELQSTDFSLPLNSVMTILSGTDMKWLLRENIGSSSIGSIPR